MMPYHEADGARVEIVGWCRHCSLPRTQLKAIGVCANHSGWWGLYVCRAGHRHRVPLTVPDYNKLALYLEAGRLGAEQGVLW